MYYRYHAAGLTVVVRRRYKASFATLSVSVYVMSGVSGQAVPVLHPSPPGYISISKLYLGSIVGITAQEF